MPRLSPHMSVMQAAAQKAGRRLLRDFAEVENLQVREKGPSDFVSAADLRSEETLREELDRARPGYAFLMEESGSSGSDNWTWRWVVDPLDGTTNFLHGMPHWAISVGLQRRRENGAIEVEAGMVFNPASGEMFWAERGGGAWLNDRRLRVSGRRDIESAVFATGIPFGATSQRHRIAFARTLAQLMPTVAGIRRFGAAALDLAWTAAGRFDGYWETGVKAWDICAGLVILREAGGFATDPAGAEEHATAIECELVAANPHLHARLREAVASGLAP